METKKTMNVQDSFSSTCASITSAVISIFLLAVVTVFPLIYDNSYFNILETKYQCFYMSVLIMLAVLLVLGVIMLCIDLKEFQGEHARKLFSALKPKNWKETFGIADGAVIIFWIASVISTLQSEYVYESFWGNEGRYSGLFLMTLYVVMYFVVSRFWHIKGWVIQAFLAAGLIVCYIGITDYFQMDILHFRGAIKPEQSTIFTSTIGNINTYTAYVALLMGVATAMFATAKGKIQTVWYYICMLVTFFAIIMGCSDNAYLALGVLFGFLPLLLFRSKSGVLRYLIIAATFATVIQCINYINQVYADVVVGLDSLFQVLATFSGLLPVVVILWVVVVALYFLGRKRDAGAAGTVSDEQEKAGTLRIHVWIGVLAACCVVIILMLIDANLLGHGSRYGSIGNYLVFNDSWGTNRGFIWKRSLELYADFPVMHKLFGYGPDTFGIMTTQKYMGDMLNAVGQIFDTAHNEYLQFLLTIGPIGLVTYLVFLFGNCMRMAKCWSEETGVGAVYAIGCLFSVACYCFQALVNLNLPIATPLMWVVMSIGIAGCRKR